MMAFAETVLLMVLAVLTAFASGYGLVYFLWPKEHGEYRYLVAPCVGYPSLVLLTHFVSGTLRLSVSAAVLIVFVILTLVSVYALRKRHRSEDCRFILRRIGFAWALSAPMLVVVLWPLFFVGAETYQATVNPDFFVALLDNEWLKSHPTDVIKPNPDTSAYSIFDSLSGSVSESARFRGAYFAILMEVLYRIPQRASLALTIALFHLCMPISLYVMVRLALGQPERIAVLSAGLLGVSSSIALGYLSYYIGQASGLGFLPLLIAVWFLCLTRRGIKIFLLAALLTSALWTMYLGLIPYAGAPILGLLSYLLIRRQVSWKTVLIIAMGTAAFLLLIHIRMMGTLLGSLKAWASLAAKATLPGQYHVDFITERFFPMFFGLTIYPLETSRIRDLIGLPLYLITLYGLSGLISVVLLLSLLHWIRETSDKRCLSVGISCVITYAIVTFNYIFLRPYGYGAFKNASWLQFLLMVFVAIGIVWVYEIFLGHASTRRRVLAGFLVAGLIPLTAGNLFSSWEYGMIGLGRDTEKGYMVVVHNFSGNRDYFELTPALGRFVKPTESVGLALVNSAQQAWAMYYLRHFRLSYLGQWQLPGDDQNMPDILTRRVVDSFGNVSIDSPTFYHYANDDYYLVNQAGTVNGEIVRNHYPTPVWENSTFKLVRSNETPDFVFAGRGFYRSEFRTADTYYMPQAMKWSADGGELFLLRASQVGRPYRLAFTGRSGPGLTSAKRTIEFFHNRRKVGSDMEINGFGRIVSDPFYPEGGVDTLAFRIKEKVNPPSRPLPLWNKDLPIQTHRLNLAVSDIELIKPVLASSPLRLGEEVKGRDLFTKSYSFNGVEPNQWIRESMSLSFRKPVGAKCIAISVLIPDQSKFKFPFGLTLEVNGIKETYSARTPGSAVLKASLCASSGADQLTEIRLFPSQVFAPESNYDQEPGGRILQLLGISALNRMVENSYQSRPRSEVLSVRIDSVTFE